MKELSQECKELIVNAGKEAIGGAKSYTMDVMLAGFTTGAGIALTTPSIYEKAGLSSVEWIPVSEDAQDNTSGLIKQLILDCSNQWEHDKEAHDNGFSSGCRRCMANKIIKLIGK